MPSIVKINVTETQAPVPNNLQSRGALISQGATTLAAGTYALLTQASNLTPSLNAPLALTSLVWSAGSVTATSVAAIAGLVTGDTFITTVAGATPNGFNGMALATVTGPNTFTYPLQSNPGAETVAGTYTPPNVGELQAAVNTIFAQGGTQAVSVLELGASDETTGPPLLQNFISANPNWFYVYLVPKSWDGSAAFLALQAQYQAPSAKTYFFTTTTIGTYTAYTPQMKCVLAAVEAPNLPLGEFSLAADFQHVLSYAPSPTNKMTPNAFAQLFGVTPYPTQNNNNLLTALQTAKINYVATGAEGGEPQSNIMWQGKTLDGKDFAWWYSADYIQINIDLDCANAVFVGSQDPSNPLVYNQDGIDRLQDVAIARIQRAISSLLANGTVTRTTLDPHTFTQNLENGVYAAQNVVNAVPFNTYVQENPDDYSNELYAGFTIVYIPQNGFTQIVFNITVTNLLTA